MKPSDVNLETRMIASNKGVSGTKNTWITFYNHEFEELLETFTPRKGKRWIPIRTEDYKKIWKIPKQKTGLSITPQVLRDWFCVELGEAGIQDRYVDAFCGRMPKSILASHYTDYSPKRLKIIYEKGKLQVLKTSHKYEAE